MFMAPTILILAGGYDGPAAPLASVAPWFAASFLADTVALARRVRNARTVVLATPQFPRAALADLPSGVAAVPLADAGPAALRRALTSAAAEDGPALLIGADLPHLPLSRLRDALTHLATGADAVLGPGDQGDWYLLGLRSPAADLLRLLPGRGEPPAALAGAAAALGRRLVTLPPWFAVRGERGLASLGALLRTMPPEVAARTRALLDAGAGAARAVGE
jgi:glycosyltransferase A (GT-A) superfamily protein (DUF2064 family)